MSGKKILAKSVAFLMLAIFIIGNLPALKVAAAPGVVTGTVYYDYNGSGTRNTGSTTLANDNGVGGVTVAAYGLNGAVINTTTTLADGTYSLTTNDGEAARIEFSGLPTGFSPSAFGTNNGTTVQFVPAGNSSGVNLGIVNNTIYSQDNPNAVTPILINGNPLGGGTSGTATWMAVFPFNSTGNTVAPPQTFNGTVLGATWGQAYQRRTRKLYSSAQIKRNSGLGSFATDGSNGATLNQTGGRNSGTGGIYVTDFSAATPAPAQFVNIQNLGVNTGNFAAARNLPSDAGGISEDIESFGAVGKRGIGDIDLSEDGNTLWAVNLNERRLVSMNVTNGAVPAAATQYNVISTVTGAPTCTNGVLRPWGLAFRNSLGYLGAVCTGENGGTAADLVGYVLSFNPANPNAGFTTVLNIPLNYARGFATGRASNSKQWFPWTDAYTDEVFRPAGTTNDNGAGGDVISHPTPILSDIEFDNNGTMTIGFIDRIGNQFGNLQPRPIAGATALLVPATGGEILRAQSNGSGGYVLALNGSVTGIPGTTFTGTGVGNAQGPGGGEFYAQDTYSAPDHEETAQGGLAQLQGGDVATTETDPLDYNSGGVGWMNNANGSNTRDYRLYISNGTTVGTQGKANGLGDLEFLSNVAPIQIGNRIWRDANGNGVQGADGLAGGAEAGIGGVSVQLYEDSDASGTAETLVSTVTTDSNGQYYFGGNGCNETTISVPIVASSDDAEQIVGAANATLITGGSLDIAYDGTNPNLVGLRFENLGIQQGSVITAANIQFSTRTARTVTDANVTVQGQAADNAATFTTAANDIDARAKTAASVAWTNIPGWELAGERGADQRTPDLGAIVQQIVNRPGWASGNAMAFILRDNASTNNSSRSGASFDSVGATGERPFLNVTFRNNCYDVKPNTRYDVRVPATNFAAGQPLAGLGLTTANSTAQAGVPDNNDSDAANTLNPTGSPAGTIPVVTLTTGGFGANNHTFDIGFGTYSIGNRVWFDTNNNGAVDGTELGISNALPRVSLSVFLDADGNNAADNLASPINTVTTDANGYYRFDNLSAGNYIVRVNPVNFQTGGALVGYQTSATTEADPDTNADSNDNGLNPASLTSPLYAANGVLSNNVVLGPLSEEPLAEGDLPAAGQGNADGLTNLTLDFGFYRMNLAGTVWNDGGNGVTANRNNGILDGTETRFAGARVQLFIGTTTTEVNVGPDGILGSGDDAANGMLTNASGDYNFQGLPPGTYRVVVTAPSGATSSTPTVTNADGNADNDDNGYPNTNEGFTGKIVSGTVVLTPGGEPTVTNATATTANTTVDFGFVLAPTVVQLDKFDAYADGGGSVELQWSTGSEAGNLGFNIYRETGGKRELLNRAPVAGNALRSGAQLAASGGEYSWTDKETIPNAVYYLEDLDVDGSRRLHGAVTPQFRESLERQPNAKTFSDLAHVETASGLTETVESQRSAAPNAKQMAALIARQQQIAAAGGAKITVSRDAWYRVSAQQLAQAGFDTNTNPQFWQLYADAAEVPFKLNSDSIEFFGRVAENALTGKQTYYLVNAQTDGLRINPVTGGSAGENADADSFGVTVERKDLAVYASSVLNGDADNWFGAVVSRGSETIQSLNTFDVDGRGQAKLTVKLQGIVAGEHVVNVKFNDQPLGTVEFSGLENKQAAFDLPANAVREGANTVYLQANGGDADTSLVDAIRLDYRRGYTAQNNQLRFTVPANQTVRVGGFTSPDISVYEISGGTARQQVFGAAENTGSDYGFSLSAANAEREMIAVVNSTVGLASVTGNAPSAWNSAANQADFVIVTSNELQTSAANLAAMRQNQGLRTQVVLVEDLFDEFSFGKTDPNAVKQFLRTAATRWQTKPNYALLFGDASYDARNNLGLNVTRNLVPTKLVDTEFMETSSDSWLADFDEDGAEDIALGRLPVGNAAEAAAAVEKLARFDVQAVRQQRTNVLIADNGFEGYSETLQTLLPKGLNGVRIDRSQLGDHETHRNIVEQLNRNPLLVTYTGHGSQTVWANSGIFSSTDASGLSNNQLSFYLLMNCLNGYSNQPTGDSLAETLFKAPNGAVAVWTSSGITHPGNQAAISEAFTRIAFNAKTNGKLIRIGDVVRAAKRAATDSDVRRTWQLVGDPTVFIK